MMTYRKTADGWGRIDLDSDKKMEKMPELLVAIEFNLLSRDKIQAHDPRYRMLPISMIKNGYVDEEDKTQIQFIGTKQELDDLLSTEAKKEKPYFIWNLTAAPASAARNLNLLGTPSPHSIKDLWSKLLENGAKLQAISYPAKLWQEIQKLQINKDVQEIDPRDELPMTTEINNQDVIAHHHREITLLLKELPAIPHPEEMRQPVIVERGQIRLVENLEPLDEDNIKTDVLQMLALEIKNGEGWETIGRFGKSQLGLLCNHEAEQEKIRAGQEPEDGEISAKALPGSLPRNSTSWKRKSPPSPLARKPTWPASPSSAPTMNSPS